MRISLISFLVVLTTFQVLMATTTKGQNMYLDRVNMGLANESLISGLKKIEAQTSLRFYYRKAELRSLKVMSLPMANRTVHQTLTDLLKGTFFSFRQLDGSILVERKVHQRIFEVNGRIVDAEHQAIPFATVGIKKANDTITLHAVQTDSNGYFKLRISDKNDYLIQVSALGMDTLVIKLTLADFEVIDLPELVMTSSVTTLKQVSITAKKPLIERKIDRMVFNVGNSIAAKGTDLTQALALTPMLRVDQNGISIVGKSGVSVMINERMVNIGGADLINYLRSLRSDDIEKIEVITTPPAKYEAQGNSGMINIVLKSNPNIGWSGDLSSSYAQTTYSGFANSFNLNYQSKQLSSSVKLRQYDRSTHPTEEFDVMGINSILNRDARIDRVFGLGVNLSLDYKLNPKSNLGVIYDLGKMSYDMDITSHTVYQTNGLKDSILNTISKQRNPALTQTLNFYHDQKLGKAGAKLSSGFNFFATLPTNVVNFETQSDQYVKPNLVKNTSELDFRIWSAQTDITLPYQWINLEVGLKYTNFDNNSDIAYHNLKGNNYELDRTKSNQFEYNEKNMAGYVSGQVDLNKKWAIKAGLRYEYSLVDGYSPATKEQAKSQYGQLFPSIYFTYKPDDNHTLSFNYSKRINRPNFRALNPFRWYSNPYMYSTGNPLLQPSFNHNTEISYLYKGILSFTVYGQQLVNGYGRIISVSNGLKVVDYQNYLSQFSSGFEASISHRFLPWWEHREFVSLNFTNSTSAIPQVALQDGSAFYYSTYHTLTLNKSISMFFNFWHSLPSTQGNTYASGRSYLSSGFRIAMAANKFQINVSADDIFKGTVSKGKLYYQDFLQAYNNYYDSRRVGITLSYSFGKDKVKGNRKQVSFRETQRAN